MTIFDIETEKGLSRKLIADNVPATPWLLSTQKGLRLDKTKFTQVILSDRGVLPLKSPLEEDFADEYDEVMEEVPNFSLITPRLIPASKNLEESLQYELNLFLDRLDEYDLPQVFGLPYNPIDSPDGHLDELLEFSPSIIALRMPPFEDISPRSFIPTLIEMRKKIPPNIAIYLPGGVGIGFQTLVLALGVDILDDMSAYRFAANQQEFRDQMIFYQPDKELGELIEINKNALKRDFENTKWHLYRNTLWTRLAREMHTHPSVATSLNMINQTYLDQVNLVKFEKFAENELQFTGEESLYHPDVVEFQQRVLNRYRIREKTKLLILLPCSAKKPYVESQSHKRYERAIKDGSKGKYSTVEVWSLTSPLGVVPRDLETVYPAQNYDIPVSGHWTQEEIKVAGDMLVSMLNEVPDDVKVMVFVSEGYRGMIEYAEEFHEMEKVWIGNRSRSREALDQLIGAIERYLDNFEISYVDGKRSFRDVRNTIQAITRFNHGIDVELDFPSDRVRVVGRPPRPLQIQKDKKHWITWDKLAGDVRLSRRAIVEIAEHSHNWVLLNTDNLRGSTLFGVGVKEASTKISPGDEVVFFDPDRTKLLGVGVASISGLSMNSVNQGRVATIRKKIDIKLPIKEHPYL